MRVAFGQRGDLERQSLWVRVEKAEGAEARLEECRFVVGARLVGEPSLVQAHEVDEQRIRIALLRA
eukprot:3475216-Prymnesium_polylepis.1